MKISDLRKAIRVLQLFPIVVSLLFLVVYFFCSIGIDISLVFNPVCGISLISILTLACVAKRMHVSSWSMFFYYLLVVVVCIDISNIFVTFSTALVSSASVNFMLLVSGGCGSFMTYLHERFEEFCAKRHRLS